MRYRALPFVLAISVSVAAQAQVVSQPLAAPLVTADNASWFAGGEPLEWNGRLYYPTSERRPFSPHEMVPNGSYRGIPLYTTPVLEPDMPVFVPLSGGLVKLYQRRRSEETVRTPAGVPQGPVGPTGVVGYDTFAVPAPLAIAPLRGMSEPMGAGTSGRIAAAPVQGVAVPAKATPGRVSTLTPPTGVNGIWVNYDGRRWFLSGKAIDYDAATLVEVGSYHGWRVYTRNGEQSTIYISTGPGRLAPYTPREGAKAPVEFVVRR